MFVNISLHLYTSRFVLSSLIGQQSQASILGAGGVPTPRFWAGGSWGRREVVGSYVLSLRIAENELSRDKEPTDKVSNIPKIVVILVSEVVNAMLFNFRFRKRKSHK